MRDEGQDETGFKPRNKAHYFDLNKAARKDMEVNGIN